MSQSVSHSLQQSGMTTTRVEAVMDFLDAEGLVHEVVEHPSATSAVDLAHSVHALLKHTAKTLVLVDGPAYSIAVIPASRRLDLHKLRELLGATGQLRLADEAEIARDFPWSEVGALPPFGPMLPAAAVFDESLLEAKRILCPAGDHRHGVLVDPRDVVRVTAATTGDICED